MKLRQYVMLGAALCMGLQAGAKGAKKKATHLRLVEAYTQKTVPGIPHAQTQVQTQIVVVWLGKTYPQSFFWRGESGWLTCKMGKAHAVRRRGQVSYMADMVNSDEIRKGDTLLLTPMPGGKFPVPAEIPKTAKNTLYYMTGDVAWIPFPIKTIGRRPDIVMP